MRRYLLLLVMGTDRTIRRTDMVSRRLTIIVSASGFLSETSHRNGSGYWTTTSRDFTTSFPLYLVQRATERVGYSILVRCAEAR